MATRTITGLDDVRRALLETPKEARKVFREVIRDTVRIVTQRTQQNAPRDTGALRQAIAEQPPKGSGLTGYVVVRPGAFMGRTPSSYIIPLEYGTGPGARPFIRSTAEAESARYVARLSASGKTLERNLESIGGRNL